MDGDVAPSPGVRRAATVPQSLHSQVAYQTTFRGNCPRCAGAPRHEVSELLNLTRRPIEIFCQTCNLRLLSIDASGIDTSYDNSGNVTEIDTHGDTLPFPFVVTISRSNTGSSTLDAGVVPSDPRSGPFSPSRASDMSQIPEAAEPVLDAVAAEPSSIVTPTYDSPSVAHTKEIDEVARELKKKRHRTCSCLKWFCNKHILKRFGWEMQLLKTGSPTPASPTTEPVLDPQSEATDEQRSPPQETSQDLVGIGGGVANGALLSGGLRPGGLSNANGGSTGRNSTSRSETVVPESETEPERGHDYGQDHVAIDDTHNVRFASGSTPPRHNSCSRRSSGKPESTAPLSSRTGTNDSFGDIASDKATGHSDTIGDPPSLVHTDTATSTDDGHRAHADDDDDELFGERPLSLEQQRSRQEEELRYMSNRYGAWAGQSQFR